MRSRLANGGGKPAGDILRGTAFILGALASALAPLPSGRADAHDSFRHIRLDTSGRPQHGTASFYGTRGAHPRTASGGRLSWRRATAASKNLPLGTRARVTNDRNGKSVEVTVNDRGPFVKNRIIDVSLWAAERLGMLESGVSQVTIRPLHVPRKQG